MGSKSKIVIIGNGIAGITAARHIRKGCNDDISVISSETEYFFSRTALMYVYMGHLKYEHTKPYEDFFWKKNRIELIFARVRTIDFYKKEVQLNTGQRVPYDKLIIASGSQSSYPGIPGENLPGVQGLYSYPDLTLMEQNTLGARNAVIIGGGLIGVEMAEMLSCRNIQVTMLIREDSFWNNVLPPQDSNLIHRHIRSHGIDIKHSTIVTEIKQGSNGRVASIRTNKNEIIPCDFVGITIGVKPNVDWLRDTDLEISKGIVVNEYLETNQPDVYAIGDCVERNYQLPGRKKIEQVWYTARMMGEVVARTICGNRTKYQPGPWFNSAKFFEIEFQNYGVVNNQLEDHEAEFYWEHNDGKKAVHLIWEHSSGKFNGINAFGIRFRHECFDRWIRNGERIDNVVANLGMANFDPELSTRYERAIRSSFESQFEKTGV